MATVNTSKRHRFKAKVWLYTGQGAWHFITLPKSLSQNIKVICFDRKSAWGSIRVLAKIGSTSWKTSLFPDTKAGAYLMPIKLSVRKQQKIAAGSLVAVTIGIDV
jgi:hypothetical protein